MNINISQNNKNLNKFLKYIIKKQKTLIGNHWSLDNRRPLKFSLTIDNSVNQINFAEVLINIGFDRKFANKSQYQEAFKMLLANAQNEINIYNNYNVSPSKFNKGCKAYEWISYSRDAASYQKYQIKPKWMNVRVINRLIDFLVDKGFLISDESLKLSKKFKQKMGIASLFLFDVKFFNNIKPIFSSSTQNTFLTIKRNRELEFNIKHNSCTSTQNTLQVCEDQDFYDLEGNYIGTSKHYFRIDENGKTGRLINSLFKTPKEIVANLDLGDSSGNVDLDFNGMFLSLAMTELGYSFDFLTLNQDIYLSIPPLSKSTCTSTQNTFSKFTRSQIKTCVNTSLFAKNINAALGAINKIFIANQQKTIKLVDLQEILYLYQNMPWFKQSNKNLFQIEGRITEYVINKCLENNIKVFDTFDGFMCGKKNEVDVVTYMTEGFKTIMKTQNKPNITTEDYSKTKEIKQQYLKALQARKEQTQPNTPTNPSNSPVEAPRAQQKQIKDMTMDELKQLTQQNKEKRLEDFIDIMFSFL